jgi:hypothetical protein
VSILTQSAALVRRSCARLLAQDCLLCSADSGDSLLCPACENDLPRLATARCPRCALPTPSGEVCGRCLARPPHYDAHPGCLFVMAFRSTSWFSRSSMDIVWRSAATLADSSPRRPETSKRTCSSPCRCIPSACASAASTRRSSWHVRSAGPGACPSTRAVAAELAIPPLRPICPGAKGPGTFAEPSIARPISTGRRVILIDDVMTTGASLNELARTVKLHGAAVVALLVLARALPP